MANGEGVGVEVYTNLEAIRFAATRPIVGIVAMIPIFADQ